MENQNFTDKNNFPDNSQLQQEQQNQQNQVNEVNELNTIEQEEQKQSNQQIQNPLNQDFEQQSAMQQISEQPSEQEYFHEKSRVGNYRINKFIDSGGQGIIKICQKYPDQITNYIIKIYKDVNEDTKREMLALKQMGDHENIVKLIESFSNAQYFKKNNQGSFPVTSVVLQYCSNGCPFEYVICGKYFEPSISRKYFKDFIRALEYIHSKNFAHRDIKIENVLFDEKFNLLVNDFGYSESFFKNQQEGYFFTKIGTKKYAAPELYNKNKMYNGVSVDIFAAGVALFFMQVGSFPFKQAFDNDKEYNFLRNNKPEFWKIQTEKLRIKIIQKQIAQNPNAVNQNLVTKLTEECLSKDFKEFIEGMLQHEPKNRFSIQQIKDQNWFKDQNIAEAQYIRSTFENLKPEVEVKRQKDLKPDPKDEDPEQYPIDANFLSAKINNLDEKLFQNIQADVQLQNNQKRTLRQAEILTNTNFSIKLSNPDEALVLTIFYIKKFYSSENQIEQLFLSKENISQKAYKFKFILAQYDEEGSKKSITELQFKLYRAKNQESLKVEVLRRNGEYLDFINAFYSLKQYIIHNI